jgi:nucleoside phosphorylase
MMNTSGARLSYNDYTVACICPMGVELAAMEAMLDEIHQSLPSRRDQNIYTVGRIGVHNVVIAVMPKIGNNQAASVATQLMNDFPSIRFGLLVGIGGGVPDGEDNDIRLGDVVVSKPTATFGGVVQYDMGKVKAGEPFERTGSLSGPPALLRASVQRLQAQHARMGSQIPAYIQEMLEKNPNMVETQYFYQGLENDVLFEAAYVHKGSGKCTECDLKRVVKRGDRPNNNPRIHYGTIGSANAVIKDSVTRDLLKKALGVLCVEMEAAGLMDDFPCLVIRGICDYADSHKNNRWQPYAATTAAAYTKELLMAVAHRDVEKGLRLVDVVEVSQISDVINDHNTKLTAMGESIQFEQRSKMMEWLSTVNFWDKQADFCKRAQEGTGRWVLDDQIFKSWLDGRGGILWCEGAPGAGKTIISSIVIDHLSKTFEKQKCGLLWVYVNYREHDLQTMENLFTSLLVQCFRQRGEISTSMTKSIGMGWKEAKPSMSDYRTWLQEEIQRFQQTFVIVDALDEFRTTDLCKNFIKELRGLEPAVNLLVTSRPYPEVRDLLTAGLKIEIRPRKKDVILYIESRLKSSGRLRSHIEADPSLSGLVIELLTQANDRMYDITLPFTCLFD